MQYSSDRFSGNHNVILCRSVTYVKRYKWTESRWKSQLFHHTNKNITQDTFIFLLLVTAQEKPAGQRENDR